MHFKGSLIICLLTCVFYPFNSSAKFIAEREGLRPYKELSNVVVIASTGRSGSTMLTEQINQYAPKNKLKVLKTHLLPPDRGFKGKIIFIFSNPDKAAESALYMTLHRDGFGKRHFNHLETADRNWLNKIGGAHKQTTKHNLLSYDALGTYEHLKAWLYTHTKPADPKSAQILAVKYENLWDESVVQEIRNFLGIPKFVLPPKRARGRDKSELFSKEKSFRKMYNLGTIGAPRYAAYDDARNLWEQAQPFHYYEIAP